MNKKGIVWLVACSACILLTGALAGADENSQTGPYRQSIQDKIMQCTKKAEVLTNCRSASLKECGVKAKQQAAFYENNLETLAQQMADQNMPLKKYKVSYFLIQSYSRSASLVKSE